MAIIHIAIKSRGKQLSLALCLMLLALSIKAQTYLPPPATYTTTLAAGSYYSNGSITLNPNFSFTTGAGSSLSLYIVNPDCVPLAASLSGTQNYVLTSVPRVGGMKNSGTGISTGDLANRNTCDLMQVVQYIDGLGRPLQTVQVKGSPLLKDIVQPVAYDVFGREATKYLPYVSPSADGSYKSNAISTEIGSFYNPTGNGTSGAQQANGIVVNPTPFSMINFEPSPLNREIERGAPGTPWQPAAGHTIKTAYTSNNLTAFSGPDTTTSMRVTLYNADINTDMTHSLTIGNSEGNYYQTGQLYVTVSKNENWKSGRGGTIEEYKDMNGRLILKRTYNYVSGTLQQLSTYYVYDNLGNLAYVLPPLSGADNGLTSAANLLVINNLCYQYQYDARNRIVQKKIPGKDWEYMVYNKLDLVVATQDGLQRNKSPQEWTFTKYDQQGRVAYRGIYQYPSSSAGTNYRPALQSSIDTEGVLWETQQTAGIGYSGGAWPHDNVTHYLQFNYYDRYTFPGNPYTPTVSNTLTNPTGLLTGSKTTVLLPDGTYGSMLWSVNYYDAKGRITQTFKQHYLGGETSLNTNNYDEEDNSYDFTGAITQSNRRHYVAGTQALWLTIGYSYDHMGRKIQTKEAIASGTSVLPEPTILSQVTYNELGQLLSKKQHSDNKGASFLQNTSYAYNERGWLSMINNPAIAPTTQTMFAMQLGYNTGSSPQYKGNIASQQWYSYQGSSQTFNYGYDQLNRLTSGVSGIMSETGISYDLGGNIQSLKRDAATAYGYTYYSGTNQLQSVSGLTTGSYAYDLNGNATTDARTGAGLTYNLLNLPKTAVKGGTGAFNLAYTYSASGEKLRKVSGATIIEYIGGIQYDNLSGTTGIDFIQTEEGRATRRTDGTYRYDYDLTDHLGNVRVSFYKDPNTSAATVLQKDDYYPFGKRYAVYAGANHYLYNKKELQDEMGDYDYGARFYDPSIARWMSVDPMSEVNRKWSPYSYTTNDPINKIDVDGMYDQALLDKWEKENLEENGFSAEIVPNPDAGKNGQEESNDQEQTTSKVSDIPGNEKDKKTSTPGSPFCKGCDFSYSKAWDILRKQGFWAYFKYTTDNSIPIDLTGGSGTVAFEGMEGAMVALNGGKSAKSVVYVVYKAVTENGGVYWGMTKDFSARVLQHGDRFVSITEHYINIGSRAAARGLEQLKIDQYGLKNLENTINSISAKNPKLAKYYQEAIRYLQSLEK